VLDFVTRSAVLSSSLCVPCREPQLWLCNKVLKYLAVIFKHAGDSDGVKK
jgi:hypothetical protein